MSNQGSLISLRAEARRAARWIAATVLSAGAFVGCSRAKTAGPMESGDGIEAIGSVSQRVEAQVQITGSTAGSNQAGNDHTKMWDTDPNTSRWCIDSVPPGGNGNPPDASASWLDVSFTRTNVTRVKLKVYKQEVRSHPVKIEVDGVQAWAGTLPIIAATGYHDISFAAKNGDDVKISMTGTNSQGTYWISVYDIQVFGDNSAMCTDSTQCDDNNICTQDDCTAGQCGHAAITRTCDDGNSCTTGDVCSAGQCLAGSPSGNCGGYVNPTTKRSLTELPSWKFTTVTPSGQTGNTLSGAYDDSSWSAVSIPHVWDKPYQVPASKASNTNPTQYADAWYRTSFNLTEGDDITGGTLNKRFYLHFDGISTVADVYINGVFLEQHKGAYTAFEIDANTAALHSGTNYVAVKVSNGSCSTCLPNGFPRLWRNYGGMYRKAWLRKTNFVRVDTRMFGSTGTFITAQNVTPDGGVNCNSPTTMTGSAQLRVVTSLKDSNPLTTPPKTYDVKHTLVDQDNNNQVVATFKTPQPVGALSSVTVISQTLTGLKLWHVGSPKLYTLKTELIDPVNSQTVDFLEHKVGIRKINLGTADGSGNATFSLNNCNVPLRGVSKHQENENSGIAMTDTDFQADWDGLEDLGVNYVRLPHYPHAQKEYELADQKGMMTWAENGHTNDASNYFNTAAGERTAYDNLNKEMVYQLYNHPSVVFFSTGNEVKKGSGEADDGPAMAKATEFGKVIRTADRVAQGVDSSATSTAPTSRQVTYAFGDSNFGAGPSVDRTAYNIYQGWYVANMNGFVTDAPNKHYISENGAGAQPTQQIDDIKTTNESIKVVDTYEPEEYGSNVNEIKHNTIFGTSWTKIPMFSNWVFRDFSDKKYGGRWNTKGIVSFNGIKKDTYYHFKSFLKSSTYMPYRTTTPVMHINGCHYFKRGSGTGSADIKVYSNASTVWLRVNGGTQVTASNGYLYNGNTIKNAFYFTNVLQNGKNVVQVCDSSGCGGTAEANTHQCTIYRNPTSFVDTGYQSDNAVVNNLTSSQNNAYFFAIQPKDGWPVFHGFGQDRTCVMAIDGANVTGQPCDNNTYDVIPSILTNVKGVISTRSQGGNGTPATPNTSLGFNVMQASTVYVMFTGPTVPAWITNAGFVNSGVTANWHGNSTTRYAALIYKKVVAANAYVSFSAMTAMDAAILIGP